MIETVFPSSSVIKNVIVASHGLNNSKNCLVGMGEAFQSDQTITIYVTLSGHTVDEPLREKSWIDIWLEDLAKGTEEATKLAAQHGAEIHFVGFSLSCLLFLILLTRLKDNPFKKAVFFAPPLKIQKKVNLIKWLGALRVPYIPSLNEANLRVHRWLPYSMYRALFKSISMVESADPTHWKMLILVLSDPRDAFLDIESINQWISQTSPTWKSIPILGQSSGRLVSHFHDVVTKSSLGVESWKLVTSLISEFIA